MEKKIVSGIMLVLLIVGMLTLALNIHPAKSESGTIYIRADGSIDPPTAPITTDDNVTYTLTDNITSLDHGIIVERDNIIVDGSGFMLQGSGSGNGFYLSGTNNVTIKDTNIKSFYHMINVRDGSNKTTVSHNNITYCGDAILLDGGSYNNVISENNIVNNRMGILLWEGAENNRICGNNIVNNTCGLHIGMCYGETVVYHNNFINNTNHVIRYYGIPVWDDGYPSGGNYWDDYTGVDANGDGIGDTPYVIDTNNQDRYPLMNPCTPPEHELVVTIKAPSLMRLGGSSSLEAIVTNQGLDEINVELMLLINGTPVNSTTIHLLQTDDSYTLSYLWTATAEGAYNVTAYALPMPGEASIENNQKTKIVTVAVSPPLGAKVGVMAGDWIKLDYTITGAPSGAPLPQWIKIEFLSIEGTTANMRVTMHMSDGTDPSQTMTVDVWAGGGTFQGLSGFVIPANCKTGDSVYVSGYGNLTIAGETTRNYAGASRAVVYASFSQLGSQLTYYWDKQTGVMVEASTTSGSITATGKATETNMWEAVSSPFWMQWWFFAIVATIIVALAGAVYFLKKRKPPTPTALPLPTEGT